MIPYELVEDAVSQPGEPLRRDGLLTDWPLEEREKRSLKTALRVLFWIGDIEQAMNSAIFPDPAQENIYYLKATGNVQLRPRCCLGHERPRDEVTFLVRATKKGGNRHGKGGRTLPANAGALAAQLRSQLENDQVRRQRVKWIPTGQRK